MQSGFTGKPTEIALVAELVYSDIFNDVDVDVVFTHAGGDSWRVPAFWAGDNVFRCRFAAPMAGDYTWRSECTNAVDTGLHGRSGKLVVQPYDGGCDLYRHGRLRVAPSKRTLEHADGTPFLWLADTWWMGLCKRLDWPDGFRRLVEDRVRKGFSAVQIVAGPLPDFCATVATWDPQQTNEAGWPWEKDFARINPEFYDLADLRLAYMVEQGLVPCILSMWGYYLPFMGVERCKRHWRYLVARYGAYPVVWCVAGETDMVTYSLKWKKQTQGAKDEVERHRQLQREGWTEVAGYLKATDPFGNPITTHPSRPDSRAMLEDESALDLNMLQTGHSGYGSLRGSVDLLSQSLAKTPTMPTFISEACYEGIMGGSSAEVQRFLFWASVTLGACGFTYGAQGIWAMSSRDEPFTGTTSSWGDGFWQDVMHYPGSGQVGVGATILRRYPWSQLAPCAETTARLGHPYSFVARIPGKLIMAYSPPNCFPAEIAGLRADWSGALLGLAIEPGARYRAYYVNPRTGEEVRSYFARGRQEVELGEVVPNEAGSWTPPPKPTMEDWLLVLETGE
jgi:hypothetical protein